MLQSSYGPGCPGSVMLIEPVVVGNVGDNSVSSYRLQASEIQQLSYVPMTDATPICYLDGVARGQPSTSHGPTCNTP